MVGVDRQALMDVVLKGQGRLVNQTIIGPEWAQFDDLVRTRRDRLRGVVLLGVDRAPLRDALARHAPDVPVIELDAGDTEPVMTRAVRSARRLCALLWT